MSDHTPGPWRVADQTPTRSDGKISTAILGADGSYVAFVSQIEGNAQADRFMANVRVMAASAELLETTRHSLGYIPHVFLNIAESMKEGGKHTHDCLRCRIDAAIAAAESETA